MAAATANSRSRAVLLLTVPVISSLRIKIIVVFRSWTQMEISLQNGDKVEMDMVNSVNLGVYS